MDKKIPTGQTWIEQILEQNIDWDIGCDNPCFESGVLVQAIAQAHEQELSEMEHRYQQANQMDSDIAGMAVIDMKKAQAQVAVMGQTLERIAHDPNDGRALTSKTAGYYQEWANQALQSAPKVLYAVKAKVLQNDEDGVRLVFVDNDERTRVSQTPFPGVLRIQVGSYEDEILDAHVIVLEGPNALQEQSKEPDKECSVNDGCQPKGKQEESGD